MAQLFTPFADAVAKLMLAGLASTPVLILGVTGFAPHSSYYTAVGETIDQPVPFSHAHHVGELGLDCRYCHFGVEVSPVAGVPPTEICMTCHSQLWTNANMLAPIRESLAKGVPIRWQQVNVLPDYVYFDHSVHVAAGVGCSSCHGDVSKMPLTAKAQPLTMEWCLACHREPERYLREPQEIYDTDWRPPPDQIALGRRLMAERKIDTSHLTNCSVCHR